MIEHDLHPPVRRAMAKISCEILGELLAMPKDVKVLGVIQSTEDLLAGRFAVVMEGHVVPAHHHPGEPLPELGLRYRSDVRPVFDGFIGTE